MTLGVSIAPEVFQRVMNEVLEGLPGTAVVMYDILVWDENQQEHDENITHLLQWKEKHQRSFENLRDALT